MRVLRNVGVSLAAIAFALLLGEGLVRLYTELKPPPPGSVYVADGDAGYVLRPDPPDVLARDPDNFTNSLGFRDHEHALVTPPNTIRIVGIGDSFVYGSVARLDQHFLKVAEREVECHLTEGEPDVEMVLMGLGGYSPVNELGVLRSRALPLKPDLVVLNFYVGNDVSEIPLRCEVWCGDLHFTGSQYPWLNLLRRSRVFVIADEAFRGRIRESVVRLWLRLTGSREEPGAEPAEGEPTGTVWTLHQHRKYLGVYRREPERRLEKSWREAERCLEEFDRLCREAGVPWVLHLIPAEIQIDARLRDEVLRALGESPAVYDFETPQKRLRAFARERGITVCDPLPEMRARFDDDLSFYDPGDLHWSVHGNEVAGALLGGFLGEQLRASVGS